MKTEIMAARPEDVVRLGLFAREIFKQTFVASIDPVNMEEYLQSSLSDQVLLNQLNDKSFFTYVVWHGDANPEIAGYIQLCYNKQEVYDGITLELKRFYVSKKYHGQGLAGLMMEFVLREVKKIGEKRVWLGVWENNFRAISFYKKWGFVHIDQHLFVTGTETQTDYIFACDVTTLPDE